MGVGADEAIEKAVGRAGVPERGDTFRPGLELFLSEYGRSPTVTPQGRAAIDNAIVDALAARFRIEDWFARHPAIGQRPVERPVFILGMPRAGTTMLVNLLQFDPARRMYWHWEGNREIPPVRADRLRDDPRIAQRVEEVNAGLESGAFDSRFHLEMGDEPTECLWLMAQDFKAYPWLVQTQVPNYFEWLLNRADMESAYRYHRRALQVLQSEAPGRWTLKFPSHGVFIEPLLKAYPDARIVVTHRDPAKPVGSTCSTCRHILLQNNSAVDHQYLASESVRYIAAGANRTMAARERHPDVPFHDIHYRRFVADPMGEVRRLYAFLGETLDPEVEDRMRVALADHERQRGISAPHRYRLEDFGLSRAALDPFFGEYVARYEVELEPD